MLDGENVLLRHIAGIDPIATSHGVGEKRVVATGDEVGAPITQIARTRLKAGDRVEVHVHPTMDEHFFFLEGECLISIDGVVRCCEAEDYLFIPATHAHAIEVKKDTLIITIGIAICSKSISD